MPVNTWPDMPQPEFHSYVASYVAQEAVAPDLALSADQFRDEMAKSSAIPKKIWLNGKEIEVYGTSETLSDLFDQLRSAGVHVQGAVSGEIAPIQYNADIASLAEVNMEDALARATELLAASHQHEFTYLLNNNHTALRGCTCGLAFVGLMAGPSPDALQWHQIHEEHEQG